jgi:hypothetical protein
MAWHALDGDASRRREDIAQVCDPYCFVDLLAQPGGDS